MEPSTSDAPPHVPSPAEATPAAPPVVESAPAVPAEPPTSEAALPPAPTTTTETPTIPASAPAEPAVTHSPAPTAPVPPVAPQSAAFRPLNVRDALSYLDKVKQQFQKENEVYDNFLTIMKDFKTQNIDTPGVIDRVSTLFRGHPSLIQGFNTFLPPGYRIECVVSGPSERGASNTITVTTPMGVTIRTQDVAGGEAREFVGQQARASAASATPSSTPAAPAQAPTLPANLPPLPTPPPKKETTPVPAQPAAAKKPSVASSFFPRPNPSSYWSSMSNAGGAAGGPSGASTPTNGAAAPEHTSASTPQPKPAPQNAPATKSAQSTPAAAPAAPASATGSPAPLMEFNHAINYVNKIKNRYTRDPETYKTFLEILQTYQKETRPIQEVYTQVTALFHGAPDLLDEFKAFLPDTTEANNNAASNAGSASGSKGKGGPTSEKPKRVNSQQHQAVQQAQQQQGLVEEKKKRAAPGMGERSKAKRAKMHHAAAADSPPSAHHEPTPPPLPQQNQAPYPSYGSIPPGYPGGGPRIQSAYENYLSTHRTNSLVQPEEFSFFDRVKKHLDDRASYTEFLKLLNLFTQEIIDLSTLLEKALLFFGENEELVEAFKELIGWDTCKDGRVAGEEWKIDNEPVLDRPQVLLHLMKSFGPSYRKLPDSEIDLACSGRDALEWSVLNDDWVAFATWASEGSGAHRKNPFEDALYNSEQERHWYSVQIESLSRTIAHFEPLAARIAQMSMEERAAFKYAEYWGATQEGASPSVYERIVKKVWGKDQGVEILNALADNPSVAVPIVLARLKQKDEEWRRAEREWNKVWREVDMKNFYKGLDHQGVTFKVTDKKANMTSKSLTTEIDALKRDKLKKRRDLPTESPVLRPLHQFELGMTDRDVLFDVLKLTFSFLDRDQSGYSLPERARVEAFLRLFVPLLFDVPHSEMEANLAHSEEQPPADAEEDDVDSEAEGSDHSRKNGFGHGANRRGGAADLRKRLLSHAAATAARTANSEAGPTTNGSTSAAASGEGSVGALGEQTWIHLAEADQATADEPLASRRFNFFANTTFYCLVRTIHTLYHRLLAFKQLTSALAQKDYKRLNPMAVELGLATPIPMIDGGENPAAHYYEHALDLAEKLFDGDVDQQTYEEYLRYMAGIEAFPLFTIDKLISSIIKHIHTINGDQKCQDLVTLLEKDRARAFTTPRQQIAYRMEAEAVLTVEESLYRLEWIPNSMALTIQLLGKEDLTLDDAIGSDEKMHSCWVASYALTSATEGIGAQVKAPLLKRNRVLAAAEDPQEFDLHPGLEAKVSEDSYQLLFVANTEDYLHRRRDAPEADASPVKDRRQKRFNDWLARKADGPHSNGYDSSTESRDVSMTEG